MNEDNYLTVTDLMIIVDTLVGTLTLADGGRLLNYTTQSRKDVAERISRIMDNINIDIAKKEE